MICSVGIRTRLAILLVDNRPSAIMESTPLILIESIAAASRRLTRIFPSDGAFALTGGFRSPFFSLSFGSWHF